MASAFPRRENHDRLVLETIPALRAFARTLDRRPGDADDLVQETLLKGIASFHQFKPGTSMRAWLFTIMRNCFYTRCRLQRREVLSPDDDVGHRLTTEASQEWAMSCRDVQHALSKLSPSQREVVCLVAVLGMSYEETAEICGCEVGTIKSKLNRARTKLLQLLGEGSPQAAIERRNQLASRHLLPERPRAG